MPSRLRIKTISIAAICMMVAWSGASATQNAQLGGPKMDLVNGGVYSPPNVKEPVGGRVQRASAAPLRSPDFNLDPLVDGEVEPNADAGSATPLTVDPVTGGALIQGNIFAGGDVDVYSFTAQAGDRIFAATQTAQSANGSTDSELELLDIDGLTPLEVDGDNGTFGALSSSLAGVAIPANGTYYLRTQHFNATGQLRHYRLYLRVASGAPTTETEPNNFPPGQAPIPGGYIAGATTDAFDFDLFSIDLNAGDTVFISVDVDPERDNVQWNGQAGIGPFGPGLFLFGNDDGSEAGPDSEAFFMTVQDAGTYAAFISSPFASPTFGTYIAAVTVFPQPARPLCTTYDSTDIPTVIGDNGLTSSTITVPGSVRIADINVAIELNHANMPDLDVFLRSPAGNNNALFTDVGSATQSNMDLVFDDEAALPIGLFNVVLGTHMSPEPSSRLHWYDGEEGGGTWTLDIYDDTAGNTGNLTNWSLTICEAPPIMEVCPVGTNPITAYSSDFEGSDGGFTHAGGADEWERGAPSFAPLDSCNSGSECWVTDLDNTYDSNSNQDLLSPNIDLTNLLPPIRVSWAQRYQMESASFDHFSVDIQQVGGSSPRRMFEWLDGTMAATGGANSIDASAGWSMQSRRIDAYAGTNTELRFHLDSDNSTNFAGLAIDDVVVTACQLNEADLSITKDDGSPDEIPGTPVSYTIVAANAGPADAPNATVTDTFPAELGNCSWTCVAAGGATCAANGTGNINDAVNLPAGSSATYTATCDIDPAATGNLINTATVSAPTPPDPDLTNNSATDDDVLLPQADVQVTKDDGVTVAIPGQSVTYSIVASNPLGPSDAPGTLVTDNFPGACASVTWTCGGAGGGTCAANGTGNIADLASLPVGGSVTYSAICAISSSAIGTLDNTVTIGPAVGVTDSDPANNTATDSDILTPTADLQISKTDNLLTAQVNSAGTYVIVASNPGPSDAPASNVTDAFPANFTAGAWTCAPSGGATCPATGSGNINAVVSLPAGTSVSFSVSGTYAGIIGVVSNTATVSADASVMDPNGANNTATDTTQIVSPATLSATKLATGNFVPGGGLAYVIEISNSGPQNQLDNPGPEMVDALPFGYVYLSSVASSGTLMYDGPSNTLSWSGSVAVGQTILITIAGSIDPAVAGLMISNQAEIRFDGDGDGTNESTTLSDDTTVGGNTDPTVVTIGNIIQVPVNNFGALLMLMLALGLTGVMVMRRQ